MSGSLFRHHHAHRNGFFAFSLDWLSTLLSNFPVVLFWHFVIRVELHRCHKLKNTDELNFSAGWFFELLSHRMMNFSTHITILSFSQLWNTLASFWKQRFVRVEIVPRIFLHSTNRVLAIIAFLQVTKVWLQTRCLCRLRNCGYYIREGFLKSVG